MAITLRQESATGATTKGSALTFAELDNNFIDVLSNKIQALQIVGDSGNVKVGESLSEGVFTITGGSGISTAVTEDSAGNADLVITASGGLANVVEDTSPQLGGSLDVNGQSIVSVSDGNITIAPNGAGNIQLTPATGNITLGAVNFPTADGSINQFITTNGSGTLAFTSTLTGSTLTNYKETIYTGGTTTGTITPSVANGNVQSITLSGAITLNALGTPETGDSMTLIVKQPSSGGPYTLSSTMKFAGGTKTLSTTADAIDIISVLYDGTNYWASLSTNFS
jgi:hypothetical protein